MIDETQDRNEKLVDTTDCLEAVGVFRSESTGEGVHLGGATLAAVSPPYQALMAWGSSR